MENRILIIEDDAAIAQTLKLNLECAGYAVTSFDNGLSVWNALEQEHNYDLALLDMMLPGVDGFTLLPKLKEYGIPVICLTAMGDAQHEVQGLRGGAEDYIAKPFDMLPVQYLPLFRGNKSGFRFLAHGQYFYQRGRRRYSLLYMVLSQYGTYRKGIPDRSDVL